MAASSVENRRADHLRSYQWKPGQSGNPRGRAAEQQTVRDLARAKTADAIEQLAEAMQHAPKWSDRIEAARVLLEHGWGKPAQAVLTAQAEEGMTWERMLRMVREEDTTS